MKNEKGSLHVYLKDNAIVEVWNEQMPDDETILRAQEVFFGTKQTKMKHPLRLMENNIQ